MFSDSDVVEIVPDEHHKSSTYNRATAEVPVEEASTQHVESLSIEDTNKLRSKLGLKPLDVGTSANNKNKKDDEKKKDDLGEFYHKPAENLQKKAEQEKIKAKLAEIREKRILNNKYNKVKTLGEGDQEDDVVSWVHRNRKIEEAKKEAEKRVSKSQHIYFRIANFIW